MSSVAGAAALRATIVDLGVGNLGNLARALTRVGAQPEVTDDPARIAGSRLLLLPGVGAFRPPREALRGEREAALRAALAAGAWLLGICVGYQLLFATGEEFGETDGLGLLPGRVTRLPETVPLPHIGWNRLRELAPHPLLAGLDEGEYTYFVHSYAPEGVDAVSTLAVARHGRTFAAVAGRGRVLGAQFHPEKSGDAGLRLLGNFLELARCA
jgi:glutamine amidotransferase